MSGDGHCSATDLRLSEVVPLICVNAEVTDSCQHDPPDTATGIVWLKKSRSSVLSKSLTKAVSSDGLRRQMNMAVNAHSGQAAPKPPAQSPLQRRDLVGRGEQTQVAAPVTGTVPTTDPSSTISKSRAPRSRKRKPLAANVVPEEGSALKKKPCSDEKPQSDEARRPHEARDADSNGADATWTKGHGFPQSMPLQLQNACVRQGWDLERARHVYSVILDAAEEIANQNPRWTAPEDWTQGQKDRYGDETIIADLKQLFELMRTTFGRIRTKAFRIPFITKSCHQCQYQGVWHLCQCADLQCEHNSKNSKKAHACSNFVCNTCLQDHYTTVAISAEELQRICPMCRGICICRRHLRETTSRLPDEMPKLDQHLALRLARLSVALILPSLTTCLRLWGVEAQHDGITDLTTISLVKINKERVLCSRCQTCISNIYRTCSLCGTDLCVRCCAELRDIFHCPADSLRCPNPCCTEASVMVLQRLLQRSHCKALHALVDTVHDTDKLAWRDFSGVHHAFGTLATAPSMLRFEEEVPQPRPLGAQLAATGDCPAKQENPPAAPIGGAGSQPACTADRTEAAGDGPSSRAAVATSAAAGCAERAPGASLLSPQRPASAPTASSAQPLQAQGSDCTPAAECAGAGKGGRPAGSAAAVNLEPCAAPQQPADPEAPQAGTAAPPATAAARAGGRRRATARLSAVSLSPLSPQHALETPAIKQEPVGSGCCATPAPGAPPACPAACNTPADTSVPKSCTATGQGPGEGTQGQQGVSSAGAQAGGGQPRCGGQAPMRRRLAAPPTPPAAPSGLTATSTQPIPGSSQPPRPRLRHSSPPPGPGIAPDHPHRSASPTPASLPRHPPPLAPPPPPPLAPPPPPPPPRPPPPAPPPLPPPAARPARPPDPAADLRQSVGHTARSVHREGASRAITMSAAADGEHLKPPPPLPPPHGDVLPPGIPAPRAAPQSPPAHGGAQPGGHPTPLQPTGTSPFLRRSRSSGSGPDILVRKAMHRPSDSPAAAPAPGHQSPAVQRDRGAQLRQEGGPHMNIQEMELALRQGLPSPQLAQQVLNVAIEPNRARGAAASDSGSSAEAGMSSASDDSASHDAVAGGDAIVPMQRPRRAATQVPANLWKFGSPVLEATSSPDEVDLQAACQPQGTAEPSAAQEESNSDDGAPPPKRVARTVDKSHEGGSRAGSRAPSASPAKRSRKNSRAPETPLRGVTGADALSSPASRRRDGGDRLQSLTRMMAAPGYIAKSFTASRTLWAPTEEEAAKIRSHIPEAFVQGRKGGLSADQWSERLRLASWTHDARKGECYLLCVDNCELRAATDPKGAEASRLSQAQAADIAAVFWREWSSGKPVLVKNVRGQISWEPKCMRRATTEMGNKRAETVKDTEALSVQRCDTWEWQNMRPATFFAAYARCGVPSASAADPEPPLLKLKDYPPSAGFASVLPRHLQDFLGMLPVPHMTRPDSSTLNLASMLGSQCVPTDLGPKCYIALGRPEECGLGDSVTRCHLDMSDAINVMLHVPEPPTGPSRTTQPWQLPAYQGAGAVWHIWRREDLDQLRAFMRANQAAFPDITTASGHVELAAWEDPVHSQRFMLTDALLQKLHEDTGVQPWQFEQNLGDAVIIPAGCAHQVRNLMSSIKVAVDFVSPHNIGLCLHMAQEMRSQRNTRTSLTDVYEDQEFEHQDSLQAETILVHGAGALYNQIKSVL